MAKADNHPRADAKPHKRREARAIPEMDLIDEAFDHLRAAPLAFLTPYYIGAAPFVLGGLWFWMAMSHSPLAEQRLAAGAFGMALLFVWMKTWQALAAGALWRRLGMPRLDRVTPPRFARIALMQAILQPLGLLLIPLSGLLVIPAGWTYAFYQNATAFGLDVDQPLGGIYRRALRQSFVWGHQLHTILLLMSCFAFFVALNVVVLMLGLPFAIRTLTGLESVFTLGGVAAYLNSTFWVATAGICYLLLDPVMKCIFVIRCFHGESLQTGEDIRAQLRHCARTSEGRIAAGLMGALLLTFASAPGATAQGPGNAPERPERAAIVSAAVDTPSLDRAIDNVLAQPRYLWRAPREVVVPSLDDDNLFVRFMKGMFEFLGDAGQAVGDGFRWLFDKLNMKWPDWEFDGPKSAPTGSFDFAALAKLLAIVLGIAILAIVAYGLTQFYRAGRRRTRELEAGGVVATPDLNDENVAADELPEDGWMRLFHEMMRRGDVRLALRALYLASLAHLGEQQFIAIRRSKSDREYQRELDRRAQPFDALRAAFAENMRTFEAVWYGEHAIAAADVERFKLNHERIRAHGRSRN